MEKYEGSKKLEDSNLKKSAQKSEDDIFEKYKIDPKRFIFGERIQEALIYEVIIAMDCNTDETVSLKKVLRRKPTQKFCKERRTLTKEYVLKELLRLKEIKHINLSRLIGVYETQTHFVIVTKFVECEELIDRFIRLQVYSEKDVVDVLKQLLVAIQYLHSIGITHRDIRLNNIFYDGFDENPNVVITDFGLARSLDENNRFYGIIDTYAPEIVENRESQRYGTEVDVWSVGVVGYTLLCGYPPFSSHSRDVRQAKKRIMLGTYCFHSPVWDIFSKAAKSFISAAMKVVPKERILVNDALSYNGWIRGELAESDNLYLDMEKHLKITSTRIKAKV